MLKLQVLLSAVDRLTAPLRSVSAASRETAGKVDAIRKQLKALNAQQSNVNTFTALRKQASASTEALHKAKAKLVEFKEKTEQARAELEKLESEFRAAQNATRNYSEKAKLAGKQVKQLGKDHIALAGPLRAAKARLHETGVSVR
ncbi:hypothetical protein, partial [Chitinimonas sp. BJB300]